MRKRTALPVVVLTVLAASCVVASSARALSVAEAALRASAENAFGAPALERFTLVETEPLASPAVAVPEEEPLAFSFHRQRKVRAPQGPKAEPVLGSARARILLRSLTIPGWGQQTLGHTTAARVFGLAELGVWTTFASFRIQEQLRTNSYERTARLRAGIDVSGRDEEFRRIVGSYLSSDDYNLYVVARDAANLYYDDPVRMRAYIAEHQLQGSDAWRWDDVDGLLRYRGQRKNAQRASLRANTALALAIANRLVSAVHAAREAGRPARPHAQSWNLEIVPVDGNDATAFQLGVRTRF
jgi:hypothetical protein